MQPHLDFHRHVSRIGAAASVGFGVSAGVGLADVCALATGAGVGEEEFVAVVVGIVVGAGVAEEFVGAGVAATEGRGVGAAVGATTGAAVDAASQVMAIFWPIMQ